MIERCVPPRLQRRKNDKSFFSRSPTQLHSCPNQSFLVFFPHFLAHNCRVSFPTNRRTISLAEYLNAVLNSDASPAAAAAASTDSAIKTLLHDLEEISEEDQIDLQLKRMAATMAVADVAERQPVVSDLEMIAAKLQILFVKTDVDVGTAEAIRNSELTKQELQFNLNRGQMKKLLEDAGAVSKFDANADGKVRRGLTLPAPPASASAFRFILGCSAFVKRTL